MKITKFRIVGRNHKSASLMKSITFLFKLNLTIWKKRNDERDVGTARGNGHIQKKVQTQYLHLQVIRVLWNRYSLIPYETIMLLFVPNRELGESSVSTFSFFTQSCCV